MRIQLICCGLVLVALAQESRNIQIVCVDPGGELIGVGWLPSIRGFLCIFLVTNIGQLPLLGIQILSWLLISPLRSAYYYPQNPWLSR